MVEMIGDDVQAAAGQIARGGPPVLAVSTPSFKGNSAWGYDVLLAAVAREFVRPQTRKQPRKINVFGLMPGQDAFYKGNLRELKRALALIGVAANTLVGEGDTLATIQESGDAALNVVLSDIYAPLSALAYEEAHGIPYIRAGLPIGCLQTERFLKLVGERLGIAAADIERALKDERAVYFDYLERISDSYNDFDFQRYGVVVADANYAPALSEFIADELGFVPHLAVVTDPLAAAQQAALAPRFRRYLSGSGPKVIYDPNTAAVRRHLTDSWEKNRNSRYYDAFGPAVILGSAFERDLADEWQFPLLTVSFPVTNRVVFNRGYAGFTGGLTLAEDIFGLLVAGR
jgi:nitrogenase molybdenum-iron protein beta chain